MNFTISQKAIKDFNNSLKTVQGVYETNDRGSKIFLKFDGNFFYTVICGSGNFIKFKTEISNLKINSNESQYIALDLQTFSNLLNKASSVKADNDVLVDIKGTKISLKNENANYSFQTVGNYEEEDFVEGFELRDKNFTTTFDNAETIRINSEIVDFLNITLKSIKLVGRPSVVSGIIIQSDYLKFADKNFSIIQKKMSEKTSDTEKYLPQNIFPTLSMLYSLIGEFDIKLATVSEHEKYISIQTNADNPYEFDIILPVPFVACRFPTEEEWKGISADDTLKYAFDIKRADLLEALGQFEGVFPSATWGKKQLYFSMDKGSNKLELSYNDMRTEANNFVNVDNTEFIVNVSKNDGESDSDYDERVKTYNSMRFAVSTFALYSYLEKLVVSDTLRVEVSPEAPDVNPHAIGLCFYSNVNGENEVKIALAKLQESCI